MFTNLKSILEQESKMKTQLLLLKNLNNFFLERREIEKTEFHECGFHDILL